MIPAGNVTEEMGGYQEKMFAAGAGVILLNRTNSLSRRLGGSDFRSSPFCLSS
jgi:hypothetical protein